MLFTDGAAFIEERTGIPVLGVVPLLRDLALDQEDNVNCDRRRQVPFGADRVNIVVVLWPRMINFTDFNHLAEEEDVALRYATTSGDLAGADVIVPPGTKNTIQDLRYLGQAGFTEAIREHVARRREVIGICGGYQMMGRSFADPDWVESGGIAAGFDLLNVITRSLTNKVTRLVEADPLHFDVETSSSVRGYVIHMGETQRGDARPCFHVCSARAASDRQERSCDVSTDGPVSADGMVWGTYIHGLFDRAGFRRAWLNRIRVRRGLPPVDIERSERFTQRLSKELDRWADHLNNHLNVNLPFGRPS